MRGEVTYLLVLATLAFCVKSDHFVDEISRHPSVLPRSPWHKLYKDGEYQSEESNSTVISNREPITKEVHFTIGEVSAEVVPGTARSFWTFDGKVPGPMVRGKVGDHVDFRLHNPVNSSLSHNVDFHAFTGPGGGSVRLDTDPGAVSRLIAKLLQPGVFVYHCAESPIPMHIEHGMYGLIVVEPRDGLPAVDHEYYIMQHELYTELGGDKMVSSTENAGNVSVRLGHGLLEEPTYVTFNGRPNAATGDRALGSYPLGESISVNDSARLFVGNIGPNLVSSYHVIGEIFDKVYVEGSFELVNRHVQSTTIPAGGAVAVELSFSVPGEYIAVDHAIYRILKGAKAVISVQGDTDTGNTEVYYPRFENNVTTTLSSGDSDNVDQPNSPSEDGSASTRSSMSSTAVCGISLLLVLAGM